MQELKNEYMQEQTQMYGYIQLGATLGSSAKSENEDKV